MAFYFLAIKYLMRLIKTFCILFINNRMTTVIQFADRRPCYPET